MCANAVDICVGGGGKVEKGSRGRVSIYIFIYMCMGKPLNDVMHTCQVTTAILLIGDLFGKPHYFVEPVGCV